MTFFKSSHSSIAVFVGFYLIVLYFMFPAYQFYVDPDATAYLTLARRYTEGDWMKAVNGYWSPWAVWLTALLMRGGYAAFTSAILVNAAAAVAFLIISHSLFLFFGIDRKLRWWWEMVLSLFLLYAVFWQSFDDLWECFFLLCVFRLLVKKSFLREPALWIATGCLGALAYYSKAYAFPFFVLELFVFCLFFVFRENKITVRKAFLIFFICIVTFLIVSSPWLWLLYQKYGHWGTGSAGSLNMSWYLIGRPVWTPGFSALLPPVFPDSPSYWEDPVYIVGATPHFWDSPQLFLLQLIRLGYTVLKFFVSINELSGCFLLILLYTLVIVFRRDESTERRERMLAITFLLFPVGYMLVNFQGRYLWYMVPLSLVLVSMIVRKLRPFIGQRMIWLILLAVGISYLVQPALGLKDMYHRGKLQHEQAILLRKLNVHGAFTTAVSFGSQSQDIVRLAYFSGMTYYATPVPTDKELFFADVKRYKIPYYFHFYDEKWDEFCLVDETGVPYQEVAAGKIPGLKIFRLN